MMTMGKEIDGVALMRVRRGLSIVIRWEKADERPALPEVLEDRQQLHHAMPALWEPGAWRSQEAEAVITGNHTEPSFVLRCGMVALRLWGRHGGCE